MLFLLPILFHSNAHAENDFNDSVIQYGAGVHVVDRIVLSSPNSLLEGLGPGITVLKCKQGVWANSTNPIIRNLTIVGEGDGVGLHLENTWSARITDVEIENYSVGLKIELSKLGREMAGGKTLNHWPGSLTKGNWGSRVTLTEIRGIEVTGPGDGIVLLNSLKTESDGKKYWRSTDDSKPGEFINTTTFWGGHIAVGGRGMVIGNGVSKTRLFGTYIDVSPRGGVIMESGSRGLLLDSVNLDLNYEARKHKAPRILAPLRESKTIMMKSVLPERTEITIIK